jgi:hypothetical protein
MNCTPQATEEKPVGRKLSVPVLETIFLLVSVRPPAELGALKSGVEVLPTAWNMGCIVPAPARGVVSPRFRFFSVCFVADRMQQGRNRCIAVATTGPKAWQIGLVRVAPAGLMG